MGDPRALQEAVHQHFGLTWLILCAVRTGPGAEDAARSFGFRARRPGVTNGYVWMHEVNACGATCHWPVALRRLSFRLAIHAALPTVVHGTMSAVVYSGL